MSTSKPPSARIAMGQTQASGNTVSAGGGARLFRMSCATYCVSIPAANALARSVDTVGTCQPGHPQNALSPTDPHTALQRLITGLILASGERAMRSDEADTVSQQDRQVRVCARPAGFGLRNLSARSRATEDPRVRHRRTRVMHSSKA